MNTTGISGLTQSDLVHKALSASEAGDPAATLAYLEEAIGRQDASAQAHFLLGGELAQAKQYDRAAHAFATAVTLDPTLFIARFQLGLLLLTCGDAERSKEVLAPLLQLGDRHELAQFSAGLIYLMTDAFTDAAQCLTRGIALNTTNGALNTDMRRLLDEIAKVLEDTSSAVPEKESSTDSSASHVLISAYTGNTGSH